MDILSGNGHRFIQIILCLQNQKAGQVLPTGCSLPIAELRRNWVHFSGWLSGNQNKNKQQLYPCIVQYGYTASSVLLRLYNKNHNRWLLGGWVGVFLNSPGFKVKCATERSDGSCKHLESRNKDNSLQGNILWYFSCQVMPLLFI